MSPVPSIREFNVLFPDEIVCIDFLKNCRIFYTSLECSECQHPMKRYEGTHCFRCNKRSCSMRGSRISIRTGTFFHGSVMSCIEIMRLAHLWLSKVGVKSAISLSGHSSHTVCAFYAHFRLLVSSALREEDQVIGGQDIEVEVDETKLGKRKYHRGHRVDGAWVVVGIERTAQKKIFLVPVPDRSSETLHSVISSHVAPGSKVITDMWKGYLNVERLSMTHLTVNHSVNFKDPVTGACTNTAEGLNSGLKRAIPVRNRVREGLESYLFEYVWRRQNKQRLFEAFIEALRDIHYY
jgi:hypothetical protein